MTAQTSNWNCQIFLMLNRGKSPGQTKGVCIQMSKSEMRENVPLISGNSGTQLHKGTKDLASI